MSKQSKQGKARGKKMFEDIVTRHNNTGTLPQAFSEIKTKLEELNAKPPSDDYERGVRDGFEQAYKNWRRRGDNGGLYDEWNNLNPGFQEKLQLSRFRAMMDAAKPMERAQIHDLIRAIQPGDMIGIRYNSNATPVAARFLDGMWRNSVVSMNEGFRILVEAIVISNDWGGDKVFEMTAGCEFDPMWFAERTARDIDWVVVTPLTQHQVA